MTTGYGNHLSFPFQIGADGRTGGVSTMEDHVRDELIQLILTNPGERLFLPEFGGGARHLVFENLYDTTAAMAKATITQAVTRWLGHRIVLEDLKVSIENETIDIEIKYRVAATEETRVMKFQRKGG